MKCEIQCKKVDTTHLQGLLNFETPSELFTGNYSLTERVFTSDLIKKTVSIVEDAQKLYSETLLKAHALLKDNETLCVANSSYAIHRVAFES